MPSKDFHVCDINLNLKVVGSQRRSHGGKAYTVRIGIPKGGGGSKEYAYYYPKETWSPSEARKHCKDHGGRFEAAIKEKT